MAEISPAQVKLRNALDYDGDGKTDIAVWREGDSIFHILKNVDNSYSATSWGYTSDLPIASYDSH